MFNKGGYLLFTKGEEIMWINNYSRKLEVQMTIADPTCSEPVAVFDPVVIQANECYVLESPTNIGAITGNKRGRKNTGNKT